MARENREARMKSMSPRWLLLISVLMAGQLQAWPPGAPPAGGHPGERLDQLLSRLELTEEQTVRLWELTNAAQVETAVDRARSHQIRRQLQAMQGDFDSAMAYELAEELGGIVARLAYSRASTSAAVYELLTPEQQRRFEQAQRRHEPRPNRPGQSPGTWYRDP
jgi:Spy/CpxP family protein refolding chaperone